MACNESGPGNKLDTAERSEVPDTAPSKNKNKPELAGPEARGHTCDERILSLSRAPEVPGAPDFERGRATFLMRTKAEPVLFLSEPRVTFTPSKGMSAQQKRLEGPRAREAAHQLVRKFRGRPEELRLLFLRQGYLYTRDAGVAQELSASLTLEDLFVEAELELVRGRELFQLRRDQGRYVYQNGSAAGQRAQLLVFDRVWARERPVGQHLHVELREVFERAGMSQIQPLRLTEEGLWAKVRYDDEWVETVFQVRSPTLILECENIPKEREEKVRLAKIRAGRRAAVVRQLQRAIVRQVEAGLPFDEPKTERGQQDGELRQRWEDAYFGGAERYRFNSDVYSVFDKQGRPLAPQVCVDFVTETLERAAGMHYAPRGEKPAKVRGSLDFDVLLQGERRREHALRSYARANPDQLSMLDYPIGEVVKYEKEGAFFRFLVQHESEFDAGDIVIIRGRAEWDHYENIHSHAFFVYEEDPISGVPILLAGNAGRPRIVTWDAEMRRAPKRGIYHRIRPNVDWLHDHVVFHEPTEEERWSTPLTVFQGG
jgi:hypothetical protein